MDNSAPLVEANSSTGSAVVLCSPADRAKKAAKAAEHEDEEMSSRRAIQRVCPFCEATCGLAVEVEDGTIVAVRGDKEDPFSRGYICPKAFGLKELHQDPDRLRRPVRRTANGWREITWKAAYEEIASRLLAIRAEQGNDAIGIYMGNPLVHDFAFMYINALARALATHNVFNAAAVDQLPKEIQTGLMYGGPSPATIPVPDIDRTHYLLIIGANPAVSHGSLMTMPDAPGRIKGVIGRGGKVIVVDPRRTETAKIATEHHFIRPGTDAAFLLAIVYTLFQEKLVRLGDLSDLVAGLDLVEEIARGFAPEAVARFCGIGAPSIRRIAREFSGAKSAVCYGRLGTCAQEFGLLASWGVDLLNILTGNLDRPGGAMFTTPAASLAALSKGKPFDFGRYQTRVSGRPVSSGMPPSSTMAEEILTPGPGQVRAMILLMTNSLRSAANSQELERAFSQLDFLVAVDFYINETTRFANIILPTPSPAEQAHYEFAFYHLSVRNIAKWSFPAVRPQTRAPAGWEVFLRLSAIFMGMTERSLKQIDDVVFAPIAAGLVKRGRQWPGLHVDEVMKELDGLVGPERMIDFLIRIGEYGDGFGRAPNGLTLAKVRSAPHGIDLGPLQPRLRNIINTASGRIELAPAAMTNDIKRLKERMHREHNEFVLIGRRNLRTSNSFMHNLPSLVKGRERCTLIVSASDAELLGLSSGGTARISSRVGSVVAPVEVSEDIMPGVVSLPHGWGHDSNDSHVTVARQHPGVNANILTDNQAYDEASGAAVLFGTPVSVERTSI
jgi:anaerobic selenocysteine-containing dehydrogenase